MTIRWVGQRVDRRPHGGPHLGGDHAALDDAFSYEGNAIGF